jgi:hypothetical protein
MSARENYEQIRLARPVNRNVIAFAWPLAVLPRWRSGRSSRPLADARPCICTRSAVGGKGRPGALQIAQTQSCTAGPCHARPFTEAVRDNPLRVPQTQDAPAQLPAENQQHRRLLATPRDGPASTACRTSPLASAASPIPYRDRGEAIANPGVRRRLPRRHCDRESREDATMKAITGASVPGTRGGRGTARSLESSATPGRPRCGVR